MFSHGENRGKFILKDTRSLGSNYKKKHNSKHNNSPKFKPNQI